MVLPLPTETETNMPSVFETAPATSATPITFATKATWETISSGLPAFLILIIGLALVLLMIVFRSIAVPAKALFGFLLTIAATMGATLDVAIHDYRSRTGHDLMRTLVCFWSAL